MTAENDAKVDLLESVTPVLRYLSERGPAASAQDLSVEFPLSGSLLAAVRAKVMAGIEAGWLTPREANGVKFGRVAKSRPNSLGFTIDAVDMSGKGPGHTHPNGEFDLCFALSPGAQFDGKPEGWVVYPPGSWHVPTVSEGRMVILYFLPNGAIRFEPRPS
ncbi:MAG: DUF4863 domain-containing protein [Deltaproteobacteria bacterium]|nr:DUF4863 domain-containing protein [Deltaproteobacteria bacterium]